MKLDVMENKLAFLVLGSEDPVVFGTHKMEVQLIHIHVTA